MLNITEFYCHRCIKLRRVIRVHGHLQCEVCHLIIQGCCEGEE